MWNRDTISGGALLLLSGGYFLQSLGLPEGRGEPGPAFFPMVLAALLAVVAVVIIGGGVVREGSAAAVAPDTDDAPDARDPARRFEPWIAIGATFAYAVAFIPLGFAASTLLYTLVITWVFQRGRPTLLILVPLISTGVIYALFRLALGARLPSGPFY